MKLPKLTKKCIRCRKRRQWKNMYCKQCYRILTQSANN